MLLTRDQVQATMKSQFLRVTETAESLDPDGFDQYVLANVIEELGEIQILEIYDTVDQSFRHVVFSTEVKNINFVVVCDQKTGAIHGHFVLDLKEEYGLTEKNPNP